MRTLFALLVLALALVPATLAHDAPVATLADATLPPRGGAQFGTLATTLYAHRDCVGPALPGTSGAHATHTTSAPGVAAGRTVNFAVNGLALTGAPGPCPVTAAELGVLPLDFTGQYRVVAVCQGNVNPGTTFVDWSLTFVAGVAVGSSSFGNACYAYSGTTFSLDVTVSIASTTLLGVTVPPTGAVQLTISQ